MWGAREAVEGKADSPESRDPHVELDPRTMGIMTRAESRGLTY